jgi:hypothetical protein
MPLTWAGMIRAGDGNRNRMTSLEGWGSTIELRPRAELRGLESIPRASYATWIAYRLRGHAEPCADTRPACRLGGTRSAGGS